MTITTADRNLATFALMRLERLAMCPGARPGYIEEDVICTFCSFSVRRDDAGTWQHSEDERVAMERIVAEDSPRVAVHRFRPCASCGNSPDVHNVNRGRDFIGHEYS